MHFDARLLPRKSVAASDSMLMMRALRAAIMSYSMFIRCTSGMRLTVHKKSKQEKRGEENTNPPREE